MAVVVEGMVKEKQNIVGAVFIYITPNNQSHAKSIYSLG